MTFPDGFDCAVGWRDEEYSSRKFGPSLLIWNNLMRTSEPLSAEAMNALNLDLALNTDYGLGHLGGITQSTNVHDGQEFHSIQHIAQLPTYFVGAMGGAPDSMLINVINAIYQASAGARFVHWLLHSTGTTDA